MDGYEKFKENIKRLTGLDLSLYKERQMKRRLSSLAKRNKFEHFDDYFVFLKNNKEGFDEFINYLTINVSEFYRNPNQWEVLKQEIIPHLQSKNKGKLKIWSAACSTGEEPYSLVMALSDFYPLRDIQILAADIDDEAMNKAKLGVYSEKSIANVPDKFKKQFFTKIGNSYQINEEVKRCVTFKKMNLLEDQYPVNFDLIVCRNVMIYFTDDAKDIMYTKFSKSLVNQGILFVGSTEQIISPDRYHLKAHKTFFYEKQ